MEPPVFLIVGPTGVGKTEIAIDMARRHGAEIVSADAFQIYQGLDVLSAKPSPAELAAVPHHLIGYVPLGEAYDVAQWLERAQAAVEDINARGRPVIVCGGTGLYVRALTHGLDEVPAADPDLRVRLGALSLHELQQELNERDPRAAELIDMRNPRRVTRALEIVISSGRPVGSFRERWQGEPVRPYRGVLLLRDREYTAQRIEQRTRRMFDRGVVEEVENAVGGTMGATALKMLGLNEVLSFAHGELTREDAILQITRASTRYAKRQLTWFRRDPLLQRVNLASEPSFIVEGMFAQFIEAEE